MLTTRDYNRINELLDYNAGVEDCSNYLVEEEFRLECGAYASFRARLEIDTEVVESHSSYDQNLYTRTIDYTSFELYEVNEDGVEVPILHDPRKISLHWIEK